jgi:hypothetical protein
VEDKEAPVVAEVNEMLGDIHLEHLELEMELVEELLLDGHNKNKSKNIIWDILQK